VEAAELVVRDEAAHVAHHSVVAGDVGDGGERRRVGRSADARDHHAQLVGEVGDHAAELEQRHPGLVEAREHRRGVLHLRCEELLVGDIVPSGILRQPPEDDGAHPCGVHRGGLQELELLFDAERPHARPLRPRRLLQSNSRHAAAACQARVQLTSVRYAADAGTRFPSTVENRVAASTY
jgi:hypothetical protein